MKNLVIITLFLLIFGLFFLHTHKKQINSHKSKSITIGFGGDTMLGRGVNELLKKKPCTYIWGDLLPILQENSFNIVNLETTLTKSENKLFKVFNFKSDPKNVECLKLANIPIVNLANNHILDWGIEGLTETLKTLDRAQILHVGAGLNREEAEKPTIYEHNGFKLGIIGLTDNEPGWAAGLHKPGINYIEIGDIEKVKKQIAPLREKVDIIIISAHWGPNWPKKPSEKMRQFAHEMIEAGVDIIHGHSAHITLGIEIYKGKLIMYSTGDFVDDYAVDPIKRNDHSFLFNITIDDKEIVKVNLIPLLLTYGQVNLAPEKDKDIMLQRIKALSAELGISLDDQGNWQQFRRENSEKRS